MTDKRSVHVGDVYESQDSRDTDPKQPNGLRRVKVNALGRPEGMEYRAAQVTNLTTNRRTMVTTAALLSSKWKLIK